MSLNFYKEHLFGFETLVVATLGISSQTACNNPKTKENLKSHHMTPLMFTKLVERYFCSDISFIYLKYF